MFTIVVIFLSLLIFIPYREGNVCRVAVENGQVRLRYRSTGVLIALNPPLII